MEPSMETTTDGAMEKHAPCSNRKLTFDGMEMELLTFHEPGVKSKVL
jgi:hypothetical protein